MEAEPGLGLRFDGTRARRASIAVLDVVSRKWLTTLTSAEETSTQVQVAFSAALDTEGLLADRKIDVMRRHVAAQAATGRSGVTAIEVAQEYQNVFAATARQGRNGVPWFSFTKADRRVTCFYFYLWDAGFGPGFIKVCVYFPVRHDAPCNEWR
jgi:hypothetical protein